MALIAKHDWFDVSSRELAFDIWLIVGRETVYFFADGEPLLPSVGVNAENDRLDGLVHRVHGVHQFSLGRSM